MPQGQSPFEEEFSGERMNGLMSSGGHLERGLTPASNWRGSYTAVGHWVAQFGMFAVQPLFGPEKGR